MTRSPGACSLESTAAPSPSARPVRPGWSGSALSSKAVELRHNHDDNDDDDNKEDNNDDNNDDNDNSGATRAASATWPGMVAGAGCFPPVSTAGSTSGTLAAEGEGSTSCRDTGERWVYRIVVMLWCCVVMMMWCDGLVLCCDNVVV